MPVTITDASIDIPRLKPPTDNTDTKKEVASLYDLITQKRLSRIPPAKLAFWQQKLKELHLQGEHDQATHAPGKASFDDVNHSGFDDWPEAQRNAVLGTIQSLQNKYGERVEVNATPSTVENRQVTHFNPAEEAEALAAVEPGQTTIHVNPNLQNPGWAARQLGRDTIVASNIEDAMTHEYGHSLQGAIEQGRGGTAQELKQPFIDEAEASTPESDFRSADVVSKVSFYATENPDEGVAEAFLQHEKGISNRYSDHVGRVYKEVFRR